ncbi:MAG: dihydrofolate reductase family protein [Roseiflexaceae bacterium]|nr:dihydrofolate reductase family protein [Roseiflexaceae bacterium]
MGKIILSVYISLDGVVENPAWTGPYWNDEIAKFKLDELFSSDALLLGRVTYQGFAQAWPSMTDQQGFADRMNTMPKFVASQTLETAEWNASLIKENIAAEVSALKQQFSQNLLIYGSANFVQTLMQNNLIDEYRLLVHPVVLGTGQRLFGEGSTATLKLTATTTFSSGVVALTYHPAQ